VSCLPRCPAGVRIKSALPSASGVVRHSTPERVLHGNFRLPCANLLKREQLKKKARISATLIPLKVVRSRRKINLGGRNSRESSTQRDHWSRIGDRSRSACRESRPLKVGAKVGPDVKSTMTVTTGGTSVSATKEAQAGVNVGKVILGPQTSTENVTVQNGVALANPEVEHSSSAMFGTERAEGTLPKGDFGVGAEIDAGVLVVGFEVGVDFDKVKDLFNPQ